MAISTYAHRKVGNRRKPEVKCPEVKCPPEVKCEE